MLDHVRRDDPLALFALRALAVLVAAWAGSPYLYAGAMMVITS